MYAHDQVFAVMLRGLVKKISPANSLPLRSVTPIAVSTSAMAT